MFPSSRDPPVVGASEVVGAALKQQEKMYKSFNLQDLPKFINNLLITRVRKVGWNSGLSVNFG